MKELTERQNEIYSYVKNYIKEKRYAPSIREIAKHFNITLKGAYDHLVLIRKKGWILWAPGVARSIILLEGEK